MVNTRFLAQQTGFNGVGITEWLQALAVLSLEYIPQLIAAIIILIIGWIAGKLIGSIIERLVDRAEVDRRLMSTSIGRMFEENELSIASFFGKTVKWFVYIIAAVAAADILAISLLSQWLTAVISYLPVFIGGIAIIVVGFILADFIGDMIARTEAATQTPYTRYFAEGTKIFLYTLVLIIGLDTLGVNLTGFYVLLRPLLWGLAVGIALAVGIGLGWGSKDYVAENLDRWARRAREKSRET